MNSPFKMLIVEDEPIVALGLELAAIDAGVSVIGPFDTVAAAIDALSAGPSVAILDAELIDGAAGPLANLLVGHGIPFVIHSGAGRPPWLVASWVDVKEVPKPNTAEMVVDHALALVLR